MAVTDDIGRIVRQESELVFDRFDEDVAAELLTHGRKLANEIGAPIGFLVKLWDRPMAFGATKGYSHHNYLWCHRKANSVRLVHKSTYRLVLERGDQPRLFDPSWGVEPEEYVIAGGAFPIVMKGIGFVGAVVASGLPERDDHGLVVAAICAVLGQEYSDFALD
ncbi:MAG: heme-binding protein [Hyphomicrobiaceae bacterium]|nr:heme-binding protein [Hyphomicrobiaceae bacterium]MCC0024748.1 heme-binding protein [Hyphomicrobiaceae bacterium]